MDQLIWPTFVTQQILTKMYWLVYEVIINYINPFILDTSVRLQKLIRLVDQHTIIQIYIKGMNQLNLFRCLRSNFKYEITNSVFWDKKL